MPLDQATVARIAHLARIRLADDQVEAMVRDLGQILNWVEQLNEVDTAEVEPMTGVGTQRLRRRTDTITDGQCPDRVLANAPETAGGFYVVPKVVE